MSKVFKAVGNAVSSVVKGVVKAVTNVVKAVVNVVSSVVNMVLQPFMGLLGGMPSVPDGQSEAERQQGVLVQTQGSNVNIPVVYGYRKLGGTVAFAETGSTNNRYLYVAYVFSEGLVEGLREVFIDDWQLPVNLTANLNAGQVVDVNADRYNGRVRLQWWPGQYFNNVAASPVGSTVKSGIFAEAPSFKDTMDFNGLAVLFARYEWKEIKTQADADSNPFSGNIPVVQVSMLGRRIASLLVDAENFQYDAAPVRYSTNPAECLLDYLRNPRYGKGLLNDDIDWNSWKRAARKCNQTVTYLSSQSITGPILTSNFVLDTGATIMSNVKTLLMGFRAYMPYVQGKYKLRIEDAGNEYDILSGAAVIYQTFTKDDIVGNVTYTGIDKSAKYTSMTVTYVDPDQKWSNQQVIYPESEEERQVYINLDGGRENPGQATFPTLTNYAMAKDMARLLFNKSRRQETCSLTVTSKALELEPGDNIRIQSNILNFSTDPWRIISFKVNDDMTVELGCVRNPDDIYPYTRVGEEDEVLPTYVPKGSIIYFPGASNSQLIGLIPPTNAVYPSEFIPVTTNPGATNPNGSGGGGVGGGIVDAGPIPPVEEPPVPAPIPVPPVNNPPVDPPKPVPFSAVVRFKSVVYQKADATSGRFILTFTEPADGLYSYSMLWWRINARSAWNAVRLEDVPGAGGDISVNIGPLPNLSLENEYYIRSFASDGKPSINVTTGKFRASQSQTVAGELVGVGSGSTLQVAEGWVVPASDVPAEKRYDDLIEDLAIRPRLSSGNPLNPRRLDLTMSQLLYVVGTTFINPEIDGVFVYYKYRDDAFWAREDFQFPANYYPGQQVTFNLAGDFGASVFPVTGVDAITSPTIFQSYDFVIRLKYKDGTTATKQMVANRAPVEINSTGLYNYIAVGTDPRSSVVTRSTDIPAGFNLPLLSQQDPAKIYNTGQDLLPNFFSVIASPSENKIFWAFNPPNNNSFRGYRIRYREVIAGADPDFKVVDTSRTPGQDGKIRFELSGDYRHSTKYQWMISVLYKPTIGDVTDAKDSFFCSASIPSNVPSGTSLLNNFFNFETKDSKAILNELSDAFPAPAALIGQKWIKKQLVRDTNTGFIRVNSVGQSADARVDAANQVRLNSWYQFQFQAPNQTFTSLIVYRRVFDPNGAIKSTVTSTTAKYFGLGAWEKVTIPRASLTHLGSGVYVADVRGPIAPNLFNPKYQVTNAYRSTQLYEEAYGPAPSKYPSTSSTPFLELMYPYYGLGNNPGGLSSNAEFLFVLNDGGEGAKALRVTEFFTDTKGSTTTPGFRTEVDGFQTANIAKDNYVNIADYNTYDAGYLRNINEALTNITVSQLAAEQWGRGFPQYNSSWTGFLANRFLANPAGITVW